MLCQELTFYHLLLRISVHIQQTDCGQVDITFTRALHSPYIHLNYLAPVYECVQVAAGLPHQPPSNPYNRPATNIHII